MQTYERLEQEWAAFNKVDPAGMVACSSGTAALHLALEAFQLPPGSKVLVPDYTMVACPRAVAMAGLEPVFVDCGDNLLIDNGEAFGKASVEPYSAFMAVHVYGRRMDMDWIISTAGACHLVIEDLAESHGVHPHPRTDAACWSFYRNKIIHGEEGGAVWFCNPEHATLARQLRSLGFTEAHDFDHVPRGHNYRLSNVHAQLIGESLLNWWNEIHKRRLNEAAYDKACPPEWKMPPRNAPWVYDIRVPGMQREQQTAIVRTLNGYNIAARLGFKPMSQQAEFRHCKTVGSGRAAVLANEVIYFPLVCVTPSDIEWCFEVCRRIVPPVA